MILEFWVVRGMPLLVMEEIKVTLETLYDILRNEKKREDLQKLEETFFIDVIGYLREKNDLLESKQGSNELFAAGERDKLEYELRSIKRILKEIYEKREKKMIDIALNKSRTGSDIIDTSSMLKEEKEFYNRILDNLDSFRKGILLNIFHGKAPATKPTPFTKFESSPVLAEDSESSFREGVSTGGSLPSISPISNSPASVKREVSLPNLNPKSYATTDKTKIKFLHPVPSFVWKDMKVYGPFGVGDSTEIFPEVADLLVRKGRAQKV
jgi:DNA replication initiation complex subunit (GINS family)